MSRDAGAVRRPLLFMLAVLIAVIGWLGYRGMQISTNLLAARSELAQLSTQPVPAGAGAFDRTAARVARARSAARDPLWRLASRVPVAGRSFATAGDAAEASALLVEGVLPPVARAVGRLEGRPALVSGQVDLALLRELQPDVSEATRAAGAARAVASRTDDRLVPGPIRRLRAELVAEMTRLHEGLRAADATLAVAPGMLGESGPRRYFVAVQNNAEARGTGGLVGAYAVVTADGGKIQRERVGTNTDFRSAAQPVVDLGPDFSQRYDSESARTYWSAAVLTPHWPSAAAIMAGLWEAQGEGRVDGVIGVDPLAMAEILRVTGPAEVDGRSITADNVVDFVMRDEYAEFAGAPGGERKDVLAELADGLFDRVISGSSSSTELVRALAAAGSAGHLQVWSAVDDEQAVLQPMRASGALPTTAGPFLQVVMNNAAGNKADYYVRRRVSYERSGTGTATVEVQLSNTVDARSVPPIVIGRLDAPQDAVEPGATRLVLSLFVGTDQQVQSVEVDGEPVPVALSTEQGHRVATVTVEVAPSLPTTVSAQLSDSGGELLYRQQPLVVDDELAFSVPYRVG